MEVVRRADRRGRVSEKPNGTNQNMRPKGKLLGLVAIFAAIGLITATGAFTSVSTARTVSVSVAGDAGALLQLQANSTYAEITNDGELQMNFDSSLQNAEGVNPNATTRFNHVFNITNQANDGTTIDVTISKSGSNADAITVYQGSTNNDANVTALGVGDSVSVSLEVDTTASGGGGSPIFQGQGFNVNLVIEATQS